MVKQTVLIIGGTGMLGHKLWQKFQNTFNTFVTVREVPQLLPTLPFYRADHVITGISVRDLSSIHSAITQIKPQIVINCVGIVKQKAEAHDPLTSIAINSLFPHQLAQICTQQKTKLIHVSTDCVFSGEKGNYTETDRADADDLYGRSKHLGEVDYNGHLTIRTSIIGFELANFQGLVEWFVNQNNKEVSGYKNAIFTGFTTTALANIISMIITNHDTLSGLYHVASQPISKFDLITLIKDALSLEITIRENSAFFCDRSLNANRFNTATGFTPSPWNEMIAELSNEYSFYKQLNDNYAD